MFTKPTLQLARSLSFLTKLPEWGEVERFLRAEQAAVDEALRETRDDVPLRQLQGRARLLSEVLKLTASADDLRNKFKA